MELEPSRDLIYDGERAFLIDSQVLQLDRFVTQKLQVGT